ncbi:MAG: hypothetical protein ACLVAT_10720 [Lachnospiraceae bacterium]
MDSRPDSEDPVNSMGVLFNTYFEQGEYYLGTIIGQQSRWDGFR